MSDTNKKLYETSIGMSWMVARLVQNRMQNEISKLYPTVNFEQMLVLMELDYEDGIRPSVLAERLQRSKGTVTSLIRHAEKNELIASAPDPSHKNAKRIFLTLKGKKIHDELVEVIRAEMEYATRELTSQEEEFVFKTMEKVMLKYRPDFYSY
ncbi:MarR family winged helix-turn-helix transcriptional regulator [Vibrio panuliri]|uniref:HTH marR-type domain-containing protein n=1 Tax=Vibrio panuliri TaxID=1381081 RepID=A0A1Q9HP64_9VIBR|nr:MarR family transcriptional regulator [Vibrio panuliri]KAB1455114.1 MarR family transcriptional regulator [Vibrio panuliri]OLQ92663.1 hypothetical protein BIY22_15175 [Vibrio panuliri]OLQ94842.1 hypothetical protein BIY20_00690 [Vibrio panuliri]